MIFTIFNNRPALAEIAATCYPTPMQNKNTNPVEITLEQLAQTLSNGQAIAGLDLGSKTIGVAVSDTSRMIATPLTTIKRTKFQADAVALLDICKERSLAALVLGLPLNMNGTEGPRVQATDLVRLGAAGGEHDDRDETVEDAQLLTHVEAIGVRQHGSSGAPTPCITRLPIPQRMYSRTRCASPDGSFAAGC